MGAIIDAVAAEFADLSAVQAVQRKRPAKHALPLTAVGGHIRRGPVNSMARRGDLALGRVRHPSGCRVEGVVCPVTSRCKSSSLP